MELESLDKYIHMTKLANGVEVMFGGQPCLKITEGMDSYIWSIYPVFAKLTYGANIFEDVPYCAENFDTMEEAIADGLAKLHSLGAFVGEVDLPEDTYAESGVNESVEDLDEGIIKDIKRIITKKDAKSRAGQEITKAQIANMSGDDKTSEKHFKRYDKLDKLSYKNKTKSITEELLDSILQDCRAYATKHSNSIMEAHDLSVGLFESILAEADYSGIVADAKRAGKTHKQMADDHRKYAASMKSLGKNGLAARSEMLAKEHEAAEKMNEETLKEGIDKQHPIVKEYESLKKNHDIKSLRNMIKGQHKIIDTSEFKSKDHAISSYLRTKHGDKRVAAAFGLNEETLDEGILDIFKNKKPSTKSKPLTKSEIEYHNKEAFIARNMEKSTRQTGDFKSADLMKKRAEKHEAATKVNEETLDEGKQENIAKLRKDYSDAKGWIDMATNDRDRRQHQATVSKIYNHAKNQYKVDLDRKDGKLDEAKAMSGDTYWKAKEDEAKEAKAKADRASAGIKEPEKKGRGKPTLGATVDEMKDRMRENIAAGKRPHTGFDRNEKLRILRSGAMEHPEFAGTHVKAAGRPVGTTKAAAIEKKKAEPTAFSMWAGLGKK